MTQVISQTPIHFPTDVFTHIIGYCDDAIERKQRFLNRKCMKVFDRLEACKSMRKFKLKTFENFIDFVEEGVDEGTLVKDVDFSQDLYLYVVDYWDEGGYDDDDVEVQMLYNLEGVLSPTYLLVLSYSDVYL